MIDIKPCASWRKGKAPGKESKKALLGKFLDRIEPDLPAMERFRRGAPLVHYRTAADLRAEGWVPPSSVAEAELMRLVGIALRAAEPIALWRGIVAMRLRTGRISDGLRGLSDRMARVERVRDHFLSSILAPSAADVFGPRPRGSPSDKAPGCRRRAYARIHRQIEAMRRMRRATPEPETNPYQFAGD